MTASADFLVEIGTEELPPKALRSLEQAFAAHLRAGLEKAELGFARLESFATPRRLAVLVHALALRQPTRRVEKRGPPVSAAFGADGAPTRAALAFAEGCGVAVETLERLETPKGAWLMHRGEAAGADSATLLPELVNAALAALPIPRRMRWGSSDTEFVRPVHWVVALLGDRLLETPILDLTPGRETRGHRHHAPAPITISRPADYASLLEQQGRVIASFDRRREQVATLIADCAGQLGGSAVSTPELLDEVTALVEWPVPVIGRFDEAFLRLPEEVLMATLQAHQRYFPVRDAGGRLTAGFIAISNLESRDPDQVRHGNERVIRPRLADAAFFCDQDAARPLAGRIDDMKRVVYQQGLGTLHDKSARVSALALELARGLGASPPLVERAAWLCRTDLLTNMVGEFPELQGIMGSHYARQDGEPAEVAAAIAELYLPRHAGDALPATPCGRALALADRLDTLAGVFALGKRPSGNKDPFGLRRSALGLLRILIEDRLELDLPAALASAVQQQPKQVDDVPVLVASLHDFIIDRLRAWYLEGLAPGLSAGSVTPPMFEAVRARSPASPYDFHVRLLAVQQFMVRPEAESLAAANKRIANILKGVADAGQPVDPDRFTQAEEHALLDAIAHAEPGHQARIARRDYTAVLLELTALRAPVDAFFDAVLVMAEDQDERRNRLALLRRLRGLFLDVADLSQLPSA
jgi:glycyl-tRNA synthetase beta chain